MSEKNDNTSALTILDRLIGSKPVPSVGARELYDVLGVRKDFTNWLKQYTGREDWTEHRDYEVFAFEGENPKGGRPGVDAALSLQMAEHVAMMTRTVKGREVREYFRKARDERDRLLNDGNQRSVTPGEVALALANAVVSIERRQLALESKMDAILERQPPKGKMRPEDWLRRHSKPFLPREVLSVFRHECRQLEEPEMWRPETVDYPIPYYSLYTLAAAYEKATRQLTFLRESQEMYRRRKDRS